MYFLPCILFFLPSLSCSSQFYCSQFNYTQPDQLEYPGDEYITLFPVFVNHNFTLSDGALHINQQRFVIYLRRMLYSLFSESTGTPLHIIFLTDDQSKDTLMRTLNQEIGRVITRKLLTEHLDESQAQKRWKLPKLKVDLLSIDFFTKTYKNEIDNYIEVLCPFGFFILAENLMTSEGFELGWGKELRLKCEKEFKWVQFLLHDVLPSRFKRIILLDIDIRFRSDVSNLYKYFNEMSKTEKVGLAKDWGDMSLETAWYRGRTPSGLQIGEPFPNTQNLNSGVVLLDLEKIRKMNSSSPSFFNLEKISKYIKEFNIPTWGDQIIYTLIRWKEESQVYLLPCVYNYQTLVPKYQQDRENDEPMEFPYCQGCRLEEYHYCSGKPQIEQINHDREFIEEFPVLYSYNKIFKLSTWCDNSNWIHCF